MQSPWQILGLDPVAATEKDAKVAYARLIREHRPDTDPEGFQRVREAYEIGLAMLKSKVTTAPPPPVSPAPTPALEEAPEHQPPPVKLPPSLLEAEAAVERARATGNAAAIAKSVGALFYVCTALVRGTACIRLWQESLHRATDGNSQIVAAAVSTPQLIAELEAGTSIVTHACISVWEKAHDLNPIRQLADAILGEPTRVNETEAAVVALRLALEVAFIDPKLASLLTNFAFPHLDREARESVIDQIERQSEQGILFKTFREDQQSFWHQRLLRPNAAWAWNDPASDAAVEYLASSHDCGWKGYEHIRRASPPEWYARLENALALKGGGGHHPAHSANLDSEPNADASARKARLLQWAMWGCSVALLAATLAIGARHLMTFMRQRQIQHAVEVAGNSISLGATGLNSPAAAVRTRADYEEGLIASRARLADLRQTCASVDSWASLLLGIHRQAVNAPRSVLKADPNFDNFRLAAQSFFESINKSESDSSVSQHVLELLLLDETVPVLIKQEALFRQQETMILSTFIDTWKLAADSSPANEAIIATAAQWYLANKTARLAVDGAERDVLLRLANPAQALAQKP